jgi:FkbM family methyltransferase
MKYSEANIEIWKEDQYLVSVDNIAEAYAGPRNIALDIGAHVGTRAIWLATDGGFKRVYAVEMEPNNYRLLCYNVEKNKLQNIIIPILAAVYDKHALLAMYCGSYNRGQHSIAFDTAKFKPIGKTMSVPLSELLRTINEDIDFMKMDVEGAEYRIFHFTKREAIARVRFLFLERHGPNKDFFTDKFFINMGYDPEDPQKKLFKNLERCGFRDIKENAVGQLMTYNSNFHNRRKQNGAFRNMPHLQRQRQDCRH